jgi:tyrosyl-tRNA synthetase
MTATTEPSAASRAALAELERGIVDLVSREELLARLDEGRPLRVKAGFDPTRPDLHIGHVVLMNKLRQFQELGHTVVFIVGDFTAQVGDPTGRNKARPPLSREEILQGAKTYAEQAFKVLSHERVEVRYNSEWLEKMTPADFVKLAAKRTVARTMERRDFKERFQEQRDIYLHELLYPLLQGYNSVEVDADIELGGTDQLFNLNVGRDLMSAYGKRPQMVMTTPLLEGLDAKWVEGKVVGDKMSKSADNYVGVSEPPLDQFKKLMLVNDGVVWRYYELLSALKNAEIAELRRATDAGELAPREAQRRFAREIVTRFHGEAAAKEAETQYEHNRAGGFPSDAPSFSIAADATKGTLWIAKALAEAKLAPSSSAARNLVKNGGVVVNGERVRDEQFQLARGESFEIVVGGKDRKYARVAVV